VARHWLEGLLFLIMGIVSLMLTLAPIPTNWQPLWPLLIVIYWASYRPFNGIMELSLLIGWCWDSLIVAPLGTTAIGLLICVYIIHLFQRELLYWLVIKKIAFYSGLVLLFYLLDLMIQFYFQTIMTYQPIWLPCLVTLGLMPISFTLLSWLFFQNNDLLKSS